jgi:hypothetical protein
MTTQYVYWPLGEPSPTLGPQSLPRHIEGVLNFDKHPAPWEERWFPLVFALAPEGKIPVNVTYTLEGNECVQHADFVDAPPPPPPPVPQEVSETQFILAVVELGVITKEEGKAYLGQGVLPAIMQTTIDKLPEPHRSRAELKAIGSSSFSRTDEVFTALVATGAATDEDVDNIFRKAGTL